MKKVVLLVGLWSLLSLSHAQLVRSISWSNMLSLFSLCHSTGCKFAHFYRQTQQMEKVRKKQLTFLPHHAPSWLQQPLILATTCSVNWQLVTPRPASFCPLWVYQQLSHSFQWVRLCSLIEDHTFLTAEVVTKVHSLRSAILKWCLSSITGASERAEKQIYRALRYHTLQDSQLHDTLRDLLSSLRASAKGFKSAERILLARSECSSF